MDNIKRHTECPLRHENGNCLPHGGFCTSVNENVCEAMHQAYDAGRIAEPVKPGKWEHVKKRLARGGYVDASECSVCHKRIMPHLKPNFCPNCGAKMDLEGKKE